MKKLSDEIKDPLLKDGIISDSLRRWLGIGLCFGIVVGAATDNVGLWLSLGLCLGAAVGSAKGIESKKKRKRPNENSVGKI